MLARLLVVVQPIEVLLKKNLPDDSFYYFLLARNATQGQFFSVDGLNPTNGFHPLWLGVIAPVFSGTAPLAAWQVHTALAIGAILDSATAVAIMLLVERLGASENAAIGAGLIYAANPVAILQSTNGLETSLAVLLFALFLLQSWKWLRRPSRKQTIIVGAVGGLMILARTDAALFFGFGLMAFLLVELSRSRFAQTLAAGVVASVLVLPWILWGKLTLGSWLQESGTAVPYAGRIRFALENSPSNAGALAESIRQLFQPAIWLRGDPLGLPLIAAPVLWLVVLIIVIRSWARSPRKAEMAIFLPALAGAASMHLFHAGIRWYPRPWYYVPTSALFALLAGLALDVSRERRRIRFTLFSALIAYFVLAGSVIWSIGLYPWQEDMYAASQWMRDELPVDTRVASFNSGLYGYFAPHTVVNLDGVVNHNAFEAIQQRSVLAYMQESGIDVLLDYDHAIQHEYAPFFGKGGTKALHEIEIIAGDADGPLGLLRAYAVPR